MNILTERDWKIMKRPIYPNIEFVSEKNKIQVQSMLGLQINGVDYYLPLIKLLTINEISDFWRLTEEYTETMREISKQYLSGEVDIENDDNIYKIEKV